MIITPIHSVSIALQHIHNINSTNRGIVYFSLGDREKASKDYDKAIAIAPNNADAYYVRGLT